MYATTREAAPAMDYVADGCLVTVRNFVGIGGKAGDGGPQAFLVSLPAAETVRSHFHPTDQFQVFFGTPTATFGRHAIAPVYLHYADGYTPYGPFCSGQAVLEFFTLRAQATDQRHYMPESRKDLVRKPGRLFNVTVEPGSGEGAPSCTALIAPQPDGLAAYRLSGGPGARATAPAPGPQGQYCIVVRGGMRCGAGEFPAHSCLFVAPQDAALDLEAAAQDGFDALVLQFPAARH